MQQQHELNGDIEQFLQRLNGQENTEQEADIPQEEPPQPNTQPGAEEDIQETIHVYFVREEREEAAAQKDVRVLESTPPGRHPGRPQRKSDLPAYTTIIFFIFLILSCLAFQLYLVFTPPTATVTLVPRSQTVTLTGTLQIGRLLNPLTLSQSQTVAATGKGHQSAKSATGVITFYNGLFTSQTIAQGTILTGADGVQVVTDQDALLPAATPPLFGQAAVSAHAINPGKKGNIPVYDIHQACCSNAVLAKNTIRFTGGQDARDFSTVRQQDIHTAAAQLISTLNRSMHGALLGQLTPQEQLQLLPCRPTKTSDHPIGAEASHVTVSVSETCSAVAYASQELVNKATGFLTRQAKPAMKTGYSSLGDVHVSATQASLTHMPHPLVFLTFQAFGTWIYALSHRTQQQIKTLIAGKTKQEALQLLASLPGIESVSIMWGDDSKLPKDTGYIHITLIVA